MAATIGSPMPIVLGYRRTYDYATTGAVSRATIAA